MKITAFDPDHSLRLANAQTLGSYASNDLGGAYPAPIVVGIRGTAVSSNAPTAVGEVLTITSMAPPTAAWAPATGSSGSNSGGPIGVNVVLSGGGAVVPTGVAADVEIPFGATITAAALYADQAGSIVVDIWRDSYANFPPTVADTITAAAKPTLSSATKYRDTTLTGWATGIVAGDVLRINVDSASTLTRVTLALTLERT